MDKVLDLINAKDAQSDCDYTVQIINKVLRVRLGDEDCHVADISDGTSYFAAFFRHQPGGPPVLLQKYRIRAYHSVASPSRKIVVDAYEAPFEYGVAPTGIIGSPQLLDVVTPEQATTGSLSATAFAEEDACVPYDSVIIGQTTSVAICGRLLGAVGEKTYGSGGKLRMFCTIFYRGQCAKITVFDVELQTTLRALRTGDCLLISRFTAEKPSEYDKGVTMCLIANRGCALKTFAPLHEIDVLHTIDADVIPHVVDETSPGKYVTLLVRVDAHIATTTNAGKPMRKLTLSDGGASSIKVALFGAFGEKSFGEYNEGDETKTLFAPGKLLLLGNVRIKYNDYDKMQSVDINQFSSTIVFEPELAHCGSVIGARAERLRRGESDDAHNGGLPPGEPEAYGVHDPLE